MFQQYSRQWIGFDDFVSYPVIRFTGFDQDEIIHFPAQRFKVLDIGGAIHFARHRDVRVIAPRLGLIAAGLQLPAEFTMQALEGRGQFVQTQPCDPRLAKMSVAVDHQFKTFAGHLSRLSLQTGHFIESNITDEMQRYVQVIVRHAPCRTLDRNQVRTPRQLLARGRIRP